MIEINKKGQVRHIISVEISDKYFKEIEGYNKSQLFRVALIHYIKKHLKKE